ncbi:hypothetical protein [Diaphorobacter caeni]|uniref:hypothetical protein n=1 Tax=Diaphorobacter caeni TaxID=2784387 RepID=UPI001890A3FC|nr:hypothetical protein [Diaphorobacter caeni]MBF5004275.1 hypothetical protein [Diaphorobacter caeni]
MASAPSSFPPKFVPTLTEEVELPVDEHAERDAQELNALADPVEVPGGYELPAGVPDEEDDVAATGQAAPGQPLDVDAIPELVSVVHVEEIHRDLETIPEVSEVVEVMEMTEVADEAQIEEPPSVPQEAEPVPVAQSPSPSPSAVLPDGYEEYVVHRVMQRVDVLLEQRLREAIALVIQEQTRSIVPRLREEVESVVRQSVYEAVADELASTQK